MPLCDHTIAVKVVKGLARRCRKPAGRLPLLKATLAKRAVVQGSATDQDNSNSSMSFLVAPITLAGLAALSVLTQKKCRGGCSASRCNRRRLLNTLLRIMASMA